MLWSVQEQIKRWNSIQSCRQARQLLEGNSIQFAKYAVRLPRKDLKILAGFLTGHNRPSASITMLLLHRVSGTVCPMLSVTVLCLRTLLRNCWRRTWWTVCRPRCLWRWIGAIRNKLIIIIIFFMPTSTKPRAWKLSKNNGCDDFFFFLLLLL